MPQESVRKIGCSLNCEAIEILLHLDEGKQCQDTGRTDTPISYGGGNLLRFKMFEGKVNHPIP